MMAISQGGRRPWISRSSNQEASPLLVLHDPLKMGLLGESFSLRVWSILFSRSFLSFSPHNRSQQKTRMPRLPCS